MVLDGLFELTRIEVPDADESIAAAAGQLFAVRAERQRQDLVVDFRSWFRP